MAGFKNLTMQAVADEILASSVGANPVTITIAAGAIDGGVAGGGTATQLEPGVVLGRNSTTGHYNDFDTDGTDGTEDEHDVVILAQRVDDTTAINYGVVAFAGGHVKWNKLRWALAADKSAFNKENAIGFTFNYA